YLKEPADKVTIEILDAKGQLIRTFTGTRADEQKAETRRPDAQASEEFDFGQGPPRTRLTNAGLTRFTWDLRYPGATVFPGMILRGGSTSGPAAVPGNYQVELTVDGRTERQPLVVAKDPRLSTITDADLREQFDLAIQVRDA